jgi:ankyrin repeat protein
MAAEKGHLDSCKLVCQEIGYENLEDDSKKTPLQVASIKNHLQVVSFLIDVNNFDMN